MQTEENAKGGEQMHHMQGQSQLTDMEVQRLRELVTRQDMESQKFRSYAQQCEDPNLRSYFGERAQQADQAKQQLLNHLG